jgi:tripeptide aminopeptidase
VRLACALLAFGALSIAAAAPPAQSASGASAVQQLIRSAQFKQAAAFIDGDYDRFVNELITLTEIPAPPFKEAARAKP